MVHESLGLVVSLARSLIHLPRIDPPIILDSAPAFADHGIIVGDERGVLRAIQHMKRVMPMVGLRFSRPKNFWAFRDEGCNAALDGKFEVLKSPVGDDTFCTSICSRLAAKQGSD